MFGLHSLLMEYQRPLYVLTYHPYRLVDQRQVHTPTPPRPPRHMENKSPYNTGQREELSSSNGFLFTHTEIKKKANRFRKGGGGDFQ